VEASQHRVFTGVPGDQPAPDVL